ncbi:hypothetical protein NQ314_000005 [Rhamnusium bicolor]|uniref:Uncharacterized protein n=1 Tax=Rhamnusium bicolor TaxID=1586634 RepID=A0AAV8ZX16_9CUCU|nr:hypothetical protein NQ314_000005 [Rhamnusium bicolor]
MRTFKLLILILTVIYVRKSNSYNILGVFPHLGKSHVDVFLPLMKSLAQKGHSVTVISHFPLSKPVPNYKDIDLGGSSQVLLDIIDIKPTNRFDKINNILPLSYMANISCEIGLSSKAVQNFMKTKEEFDLMIIEFFNSDCFLSLYYKIKAPIVGITSSTLMPWSSERFANPTHTAYIPNNCMDYSDKMTFLERLENTVVTLYHQYHYEYYTLSRDEQIARKFLGRKASQITSFIKNSGILLTNTHFSLNLPRPLVPNVVEVGGIHIGGIRPLPKVRKYSYIICLDSSDCFVNKARKPFNDKGYLLKLFSVL